MHKSSPSWKPSWNLYCQQTETVESGVSSGQTPCCNRERQSLLLPHQRLASWGHPSFHQHALSWETILYQVGIHVQNNNQTAPNLKISFSRRRVCHDTYNVQNNEIDLALPKPKTEFLKISFKSSGAMLWNDLSQETKLSETLYSFKRHVHRT